MSTIAIDILDSDRITQHFPRFADLLVDSVEGGALIGHVIPVNIATVTSSWEDVAASVGAGERLLICATVEGLIAGTVQLYLSPEPNAPHRGEVYKLLVHRELRNRGIGEALMLAVETEARKHARSLLLLDTVQGALASASTAVLGGGRSVSCRSILSIPGASSSRRFI